MSAAAQTKAMTSGTSAVAGRPAPASAPQRAPLSLVRTLPVRRRAPFAIFCLGVLAAALITVLVLNISVTTGQYQLVQLRNEQLGLEQQNQDLQQRVQNYEAPQNLAARAAQLGMVAATSKGQIDLKTLMVTGQPKPAEKGTPQGAVIAAPEVAGYSANPAPSAPASDALKQTNAAAKATSAATPAPKAAAPAAPAPPVVLNGGTVPAPKQKTPGQ
jgi:cell division protein FtsL